MTGHDTPTTHRIDHQHHKSAFIGRHAYRLIPKLVLIVVAICGLAVPLVRPPTLAHASESAYTVAGGGVDNCGGHKASSWMTFWSDDKNAWNLGFYLGGDTAVYVGCQIEKSSSWLSDLKPYWNFMPIYDSLQLPCSGLVHRMSSNTSTARSQGETIADHATNAAHALGLDAGSIVYLDLEGAADGDTAACNAAGEAFVDGWIQELHWRGMLGGVYGSACNPDMDIYASSSVGHKPDDVWIADWNAVDSASTSSVSCVDPHHWDHHQRIHQYDHDLHKTYGGIGFKIDEDCIDGQADTNDPSTFSC